MDQRRRRCAPICARLFPEADRHGGQPRSNHRARILGNDRPGSIASSLRKAFWDRRREGWHVTLIAYS
jgi:branched-chain amino acid aminotransferase